MMRRRAGVKPSRAASAFAAIVGVGMLVVAVPVFFGASGHPPSGPPGPSGPSSDNPASAFFVLWVVGLVGIILYHVVNALSDHAPPVQTIEMEPAEADGPPPRAGSAVASQLRELEQLRQEGLITQTEYDQKRRDVLDTIGKGGRTAA